MLKGDATLPYDMFLTRVLIRAQLPLDGHRADNKRPTSTMKNLLCTRIETLSSRKGERRRAKRRRMLLQLLWCPALKRPGPTHEGKKKKKGDKRASYPFLRKEGPTREE